MVDPTTVNKFLAQPTRGSDVGTWDTPVNGNMGIIDNSFGGLATIALLASPVTLSSAQYQCTFLRFTGAITANVAVTLPAVGSFYSIINDTTNSSNFTITMLTTAGGARQIGLPPGTMTEIMTDGTNTRFRGLPFVGSYWDYGGSSVPAWVTACTIPPYLNCDGTTFSSATYPALTALLGGTTLPDSKGRFRATLNQGTARMTSTYGVDGNTIFAAGGAQNVGIAQANLPNYALTVTDPGHSHALTTGSTSMVEYTPGSGSLGVNAGINFTNLAIGVVSATTGITVNSGGGGAVTAIMNPVYIGGITMIRAA